MRHSYNVNVNTSSIHFITIEAASLYPLVHFHFHFHYHPKFSTSIEDLNLLVWYKSPFEIVKWSSIVVLQILFTFYILDFLYMKSLTKFYKIEVLCAMLHFAFVKIYN